MNRQIIDIYKWELVDELFLDEMGTPSLFVKVYYKSLREGELIEKKYHVTAMSEHYIMLENFAIKRESWARSDKESKCYLNLYEVLEILERSANDGR